jgi:hypothetical protein
VEYPDPCCPLGNEDVEMLNEEPAAETVMLSGAVAVWGGLAESLTVIENEYEPDCVGVPAIVPDVAPRLSPGGSWPDDTLQP